MKKLIDKFTIEYLNDKNEYLLRLTPDAQDEISSISELNIMVKEGSTLDQNELLMALKTNKNELSFKMPIKAVIAKINEKAIQNPSLVLSVYDDENWIVLLKDINKEEYDKLEEFAMWDRYQSLIG
ncbi:Glycine cleavage system H protein [Mycoplasmopsis agalactiae 14628]|uniref:Glycine cleavage system H protein n=1 Tax=Mycoplasmopsis agalactiae 14628 TaxID=1110504 RepID=I5D6N6_MYCAA|nr:glycine cleavage system protein H [Mycoplasmopsis agalactiae]EIN15345.1 Glycine cleavage system H protein [Mycoplasmopsis agalactiae 14628]